MNSAPNVKPICHWPCAPSDPALSPDTVHVWCADLDLPAPVIQRLQDDLSLDERRRAARFHYDIDRDRYIARHGLLRLILGGYLHISPAQLKFIYNSYSKPALSSEFESQALQFNLSHSQGLALIAVSCGRAVGVDIEWIWTDVEYRQIAESYFSPVEKAALNAINDHDLPLAFFNCWVCKEAFIKAHGEGLSLPLDQFDVCVDPNQPARLLDIRGEWGGDSKQHWQRWGMQRLQPATGYIAAIAAQDEHWELACWQTGSLTGE